MSAILDQAVAELNARLAGKGFAGTALVVLSGEGSLLVEDGVARVGEGPAEVTLTATAETFRDIVSGALGATSAFMSGKLTLDGDMGAAMRLGSALS